MPPQEVKRSMPEYYNLLRPKLAAQIIYYPSKMSTIENNQAAWHTVAATKPLKVGPGPDQTKLEADEVLIQVAAVAINPSEWKVSR